MAIFHLSVKTVSRSSGRSAVAAAAYRAGEVLIDQRKGDVHDYTRKRGVVSTDLVLPEGSPEYDRSSLWNAAEESEKRKNSTVAREFEIGIPAELDAGSQRELVLSFVRKLVERHGCAADVAIHDPDTHRGSDERNKHAHILLTTRRITPDGFGAKCRELDDRKTGIKLVKEWREIWADMQNEALEQANCAERVDHRSHRARGLDVEPTIHMGAAANDMERKGKRTEKGDINREVEERNAVVIELAELRAKRERQIKAATEAMAAFEARAALAQANAEAAKKAAQEAEQARLEALAMIQAEQERAAARAAFEAKVMAQMAAEREQARLVAEAKQEAAAKAAAEQAAAKAAFEAKAQAERERRINDLERISKRHMTAGLTVGTMGLKAIKDAGGDPSKVDWVQLEQDIAVRLTEYEFEPVQILKALLEHSPARPAITAEELERALEQAPRAAHRNDDARGFKPK